MTQGATTADGDADGDGAVGANDLALWSGSVMPEEQPEELTVDPDVAWLAFEQPETDQIAEALVLDQAYLPNSSSAVRAAEPYMVGGESASTLTIDDVQATDAAMLALAEDDPLARTDAL
jgi:hypothetical protein